MSMNGDGGVSASVVVVVSIVTGCSSKRQGRGIVKRDRWVCVVSTSGTLNGGLNDVMKIGDVLILVLVLGG